MTFLKMIFAAMLTVPVFAKAPPPSRQATDDQIYETILDLINDGKYDVALSVFTLLSSGYRDQPRVVLSEAGAHAGLCGLDFIDFTSRIGSDTPLFAQVMEAFTWTDVRPFECQAAQEWIESKLGETREIRDADLDPVIAGNVDFSMAVFGLAKIGAVLRGRADVDQDGTVDGGFDSCSAQSLTDADVVLVGTGLGAFFDNFSTIAASLGSSTNATLGGLQALCAALSPDLCRILSTQDAAWENADSLKLIRGLVKSSRIGIEAGNENNPFLNCP